MRVDRTRLPALGSEPRFEFPEIRRRTLQNGVRAWTVAHHAVPLTSVLVLIPAGAAADPVDRPGLAAITGDLLDEGCGTLDALALHETLGRLGAQLDSEIGSDATLIGITALARCGDDAMALLADVIQRPQLAPKEFDRVRDLRLNRLTQLRDMPPSLAERAFANLVYGQHPYAHMPIGSEESLRAMTVLDARRFHQRMYDPARAVVIAVGDASHETLAEAIERAFGGWTAPDAAPAGSDPALQSTPDGATRRIALVHRAGAPQSELRIGHVAAPRSTPDYHALVTANMILGGQFVSRINMNLREEKGYTYGARTYFDFRRGRGPFMLQASVQSDATAEAVRESLLELRGIRGERPVTAEELTLGRAALTRGYPRGFETGAQIGRAAAQLALYDLPDDYFYTFVPKVLALDPDAVTRAAAAHIDPDRLVTVVVGDADKVRGPLEALDIGPVEVIG